MATSVLSKDPAHRLKRVQVLIVDNDPAIVDLLSSVLSKLGFGTVHKAQDGFQAIDVMRHHKIDLMITDWDLKPVSANQNQLPANNVILPSQHSPDNGSMFLKFLRGSKHSPNPYLSVIMMTGAALREDIAYARDSGVNEVLVKPVSADALCSRIMMVVEQTRPFVTARNYRGPCRRRRGGTPPPGMKCRRVADIKVIKFGEKHA